MIPSAVTPNETEVLQRLADGKRVLEVGSLLGYSTVRLAEVAKSVVSIDPHEGYPAADPRPTLGPFINNLKAHGVRDKVTVCVGFDWQVLPVLARSSFDLAFIDTTGLYEDTWRIMHAVIPYLRHCASLAVHDCGHPEWPGAERAIQDFARVFKRTYVQTDKLAVFGGTWPSKLL